jgi:hypothetical protein
MICHEAVILLASCQDTHVLKILKICEVTCVPLDKNFAKTCEFLRVNTPLAA